MKLLEENEIPKQLLEIPQPPKKLYCIGTIPKPGSVYLTIVGSRKHTSYGRDVCEKLIEGLRGYPIVIVSGLALGIDSIAHRKAIDTGLTTVAFPGSGLNPKNLYPASNRVLAEKIVTSGGALISEFEPDTKAAMWTFPKRNRLMAGIAKAVLIIEAQEKSGTLITSKLATEYNRDIGAVPGSIFSELSAGTHMLIRLGATPIANASQLLELLGFEPTENTDVSRELIDCSIEELQILDLLREPIPKDELLRLLQKPIHEANATISILEIKGLIKEELGEIRRC